jgi:hyperosmotically inducible protein
MTTPQLLAGAFGLVLAATAGCNRADADREARDAAAGVRAAAGQAGERLADSWLTTKVQAQYFADDDVKGRYINVATRDGVVTIKGYVESQAAREQALQIARNTDGVRSVEDQLLIGVAPDRERFEAGTGSGAGPVATTGAETYDDEHITNMVQARFFLDPAVKARMIEVETRNGVVTLRGQVASETERAQALLVARQTSGVGRVEDLLTIESSLTVH